MDKLDREHVEFTMHSAGWKILVNEFKKRQDDYKEFIMDCNLDEEAGRNNAKNYQAMFHTTDAFLEQAHDILQEEKG